MTSYVELPTGLPRPENDGACDHLVGMAMPALRLPATSGGFIDLARLPPGRTVIYAYPMTGVPGRPLPAGWDAIPGARGCTPQACGFRDHLAELAALGAAVFGLSTQAPDYQREMAERLHLPFAVLSDAEFRLTRALRLPTFTVEGAALIKRLTMIVWDGRIGAILYPVFPPDQSAAETIAWLRAHPA